jgi:hypothetical protein
MPKSGSLAGLNRGSFPMEPKNNLGFNAATIIIIILLLILIYCCWFRHVIG